MEDQFVPYEIAIKLKELGFDEPCLAYFSTVYDSIAQEHNGKLILGKDPENLTCQKKMHYLFGQQILLAPLWQQAIDWIGENHCILIQQQFNGYTIVKKIGKNEFILVKEQLPDKGKNIIGIEEKSSNFYYCSQSACVIRKN